MSESSYDLLFKGECLPDADPEQVRASVARLLKLDAEQLAQMFCGRTMVVRRAADRANAARFQQAFKQAGARLRVVPASATADAERFGPAPTAAATAPAWAAPTTAAGTARKSSLAERLAAQAAADAPAGSTLVDGRIAWQPPQVARPGAPPAGPAMEGAVHDGAVQEEEPGLRLAPLGADLLSAKERAQASLPPVHVDISQLAVAPSAGNLPTLQRVGADVQPPNVPDLTVSPPGAELGEHKDFVELALDLSHLSLAEPGARVGPERAEVVVDIDVSGLSLAAMGSSAGVGGS